MQLFKEIVLKIGMVYNYIKENVFNKINEGERYKLTEVDLKKEYFLKGNKGACLLIHGFTSTPGELYELGKKINENGYTVLGVRLKGHGTTVEEMNNCTYEDWIESCVEGYKRLKQNYDNISVIGHSMGSLLALNIAENYEIDKVIALSPPIVVKDKRAKFACIVKYFIKYTKWKEKERPEEEKKYLLGYNKVPLKSVHELNKLTSLVRRNLNKVNKPLLIVHSHNDQTVDEKSIEILSSNVSSKVVEKVFLNKSGHNITVECEKEKVFNSVIRFLNKKF